MRMTRDQHRARYAYERVARIAEGPTAKDYKIVVMGIGANIMRSGLASAIAFLERRNSPAVVSFLDDLSGASIPGLEEAKGENLPDRVRNLTDLDAYMLATRETLRVALWFRRAVQALVRDK